MSTLERDYRKMAKPPEVEGLGDLYLIRPLGAVLVQGFRHLPISPTGVSILAVLSGWAAAWFYFRASSAGAPVAAAGWAALLFLVHSALDSADGQLARLTGRQSDHGRLIDGACDSVVFIAIFFAIWLGYVVRGGPYPAAAFVFALFSGLVYAFGASLIEYLRLLYQDWALGKVDVSATSPERLTAGIYERVGPLGPFFERWYSNYSFQQRLGLPVTARLQEEVTRLRAEAPEGFARFREIYAREQYARLRRWWPMAPNLHKVIIVVCAFVPAQEGGLLAGLGAYWTFVANVALIPVALALIRAQSRADRRMLARVGEIAAQYTGGGSSSR